MRFLLYFLSLTYCVLGGGSNTDSIQSSLKSQHQKPAHVSRRVEFSEEANQTHTFEVRRYPCLWDPLLFFIEDMEEKMPAPMKAWIFATMGFFSFQHMLYNSSWWCQILAGRVCYVFAKRLYFLVGKFLSEGAQPAK